MTDIVERLRSATPEWAWESERNTVSAKCKDLKEAADEIERLRTELEGVYDCLNDWSAFGFDPATNHLHADDGGAPAHCLLYVPKEI